MANDARYSLLAGTLAWIALCGVAPSPSENGTTPPSPEAGTRFYVPGFQPAARQQWSDLINHGNQRDAELLAAMESVSHGVWIVGGTPVVAHAEVHATVLRAAGMLQVPVLVAYNIPGRDCSGYSAGGARTAADYEAWIDAFAEGIGDHQAVVILEPDGLGLLPSDCGHPNGGHPFTDADRYAQLNHAVDRLRRQPRVAVYLDGTHSQWLAVGEIAHRLVAAGVQRAQGFFVNVSNYQATDRLIRYATWISDCIAFAGNPADGGWRLGHYDLCANQPNPAKANDFSTWSLTDQWYASTLGGAVASTHFVIDTSRNGRGPWTAPASYADPQDWCNPPGRGIGIRPSSLTGVPLLDAYLWVKVPGESDGSCTRGTANAGTDPEWAAITGDPRFVDPPAGQWFPQQALQLARLASPPLTSASS